MRLLCYECGKSVSTEVPSSTIIRAVLICPECICQMMEDGRWNGKEYLKAKEAYDTFRNLFKFTRPMNKYESLDS